MSTCIWHNRFEHDWMRAFPLGNGRIGAMLYGNPFKETIEMNEESLWSGKQHKEMYHSSPEILQELRSLLFQERYEEATELCTKTFLANPSRVRFYESFGELSIELEDKREYTQYRKELELSEAIARVSYQKGNDWYRSETFISETYDVLVHRMVTEGTPFSCKIMFQREQDAYTSALNHHTLVMNGCIVHKEHELYGEGIEGMQFGARIYVVSDGVLTSDKTSISIENATNVTIYGAFATNYNVNQFDNDETISYRKKLIADINAVKEIDYDTLKQEHIKEHKKWFDTLSFELDAPSFYEIPTDERVNLVKNDDVEDTDLYVLYYNFGRYLLIESSGKRATLPANLQGIWCHGFTPPWGSDYHTNINLQMNYWPAESANMSDTAKPLIHFVKMLSMFGKDTAKELFFSDGWAINHTTDIFGRTGVHDYVSCGFFPMAGPWLCLNLWEHYEYTDDVNYLKEIYPILKDSCKFVKEYLVEDSNGYLVTSPSNSPENHFYYIDKNGEKKSSGFTYGATMDFQIIYALFTRVIVACDMFHDTAFAKELEELLEKLPPFRISERYGTICEWIKDYEEVEPGHRHISHLFGLFPSDQIKEEDTEIYEAARKTIERRLSFGGGKTGWSRAWIINFFARLKDGTNALAHLHQLMKLSTAENLFDMHPPFQIDGNFGAVSGITEMLLQSHEGNIGERIVELLPALPSEWKKGSVKGIKARGNFVFDIDWADNKVTKVRITSNCENTLRLKVMKVCGLISTQKAYTMQENVLKMDFIKGEIVEILYL